jgi:glycosyltransferase involved in cell wall biosynthesis
MAHFLGDWRVSPQKVPVAVVPHGIDLDRFSFQTRKRSEPIRIVSLGHGCAHKDQALLIDMMEILLARGCDAMLEMTVDDRDAPEYVARLRRQVGEARLGDRVMFVGRVDPVGFLAGADIAVLASLTESFGFPVAEAMASGIPVVASSIPAFCELLGENGWFFDAGDAAGAAARVIEVLAAPRDEFARRRSAALRRVEGMSWEHNASLVAHLIEQYAEDARRPGRWQSTRTR